MMSSLPRSLTSLLFLSLVQDSATPTSRFLGFPEVVILGEELLLKELETDADASFTVYREKIRS